MLSLRILAAAFVLSTVTTAFAACFPGPTTGASRSSSAHASSAAAGGAGGSSGTGGATTAGNGGTGGASGAGGASGTGGASAGAGAGPSDGGFSDVSPDAIGMGGLPLDALCGAFATSDASTCGLGLACCPPCPQCDTLCVVPCNPKMHGCVGGCLPKATP